MNTLQKFEAKQLEKITQDKKIPEFSAGDTLRVNVLVREGGRERVQAYEGVCIAKNGGQGINASFTVRKISYGEGVERVFPLFSPRLESIEVIRRGSVRRAKLYYLRERRGKKARISERTTGRGMKKDEGQAAKPKKAAKSEAKSEAKAKKDTKKKKTAKKSASKKKTESKKK